ncbi:hypothetical protein DFH09DRAFT_1100866 [Mycena vulgaris]|nr:hypothetical protein DFH09DRAFT_1100866 [Mycena vulgaris]
MDVALPKPTASPEQVRVGCPSKCPQVAIMTSAIMLAPCVPKVVEPVTLVVHSAEEIMSVAGSEIEGDEHVKSRFHTARGDKLSRPHNASLERVAVEKQNIEILVQIGAGRETECMNPPSRGFRGGFNLDKSWSYGDGVARPLQGSHYCTAMCLRRKVCTESLCQQIRRDLVSKPRRNSRFRQDSLTDQQDLGCGLIGSCFRPRTRPNMDESSCVLSVSVLYPAGARWLLLRGRNARTQVSQRAYPEGFPWVEPVSRKVRTVGGIQDVWGARALELCDILREEVVGGAVGVVRGGFPWEGAQRSKSGDCVMSSPSQPRWCARAYAECMGPSQRIELHLVCELDPVHQLIVVQEVTGRQLRPQLQKKEMSSTHMFLGFDPALDLPRQTTRVIRFRPEKPKLGPKLRHKLGKKLDVKSNSYARLEIQLPTRASTCSELRLELRHELGVDMAGAPRLARGAAEEVSAELLETGTGKLGVEVDNVEIPCLLKVENMDGKLKILKCCNKIKERVGSSGRKNRTAKSKGQKYILSYSTKRIGNSDVGTVRLVTWAHKGASEQDTTKKIYSRVERLVRSERKGGGIDFGVHSSSTSAEASVQVDKISGKEYLPYK